MPTAQWQQIPFALTTPFGGGGSALPLNAYLPALNPETGLGSQTGAQWLLDASGCAGGAGKRVARDNIPQKPGEIPHRKYRSGLVVQLLALAADVKVAGGSDAVIEPVCDADLVDLFDLLLAHLHAVENNDGRLLWLPTGKPARMQLDARWLGSDGQGGGGFTSVDVEFQDQTFVGVRFALLSPFPYAMDAAEVVTCVGGATPHCSGSPDVEVLTNAGTSEFWPVMRVYGPTSGFQIDRLAALTGETQSFIYSAAFPGAPAIPAGHFVELDFFRETAYIDANLANAKPGIDVENSDFWPLEIGANTVTITGAAADILWQNAYTG